MEENRKAVIQVIFLLVGAIFLVRLFWIQVIDRSYRNAADHNAIKQVINYPHRGQIFDRHGHQIVINAPVYDISFTPNRTRIPDTLAFCDVMGISRPAFDSLMTWIKNPKKNQGYSSSKPQAFLKQVSVSDYARIQDRLIDFPGFFATARTVRSYPHQSLANVLGYIGEISKEKLDKLEKQGNSYYRSGDYIGLSGLEAYYENQLRGRRGVRYVMVDVHGVEKGPFKGGVYDTAAIVGESLVSTIDLELQQYCEKMMEHKVGSIVAIEPATGEILAMVSTPSYNPNLLTGREYSRNYAGLQRDPLKPLFNRALMSPYPPGSFFKVVQALAALQAGAITPSTIIPCGNAPVKCHPHPAGHNDLHNAIQWSCNPYFYYTFRRNLYKDETGDNFVASEKGYAHWREQVLAFGLGERMGIDLPNEQRGILKQPDYFNKVYGKGRWQFSNLYSMAIGQGELGVVPIQMANLAAIVANRGWYYTPHLVREVGSSKKPLAQFTQRRSVGIDAQHFPVIIDGMEDVIRRGTVWSQARLDSIAICGKTSTVQNPQGKDHAAFIGFAPKENPKIAIAVFLENAGWGGFEAAPIASLIIEKYLRPGGVRRKNLERWMQQKDYLPDWAKEPAPTPDKPAPAEVRKTVAVVPEKRTASTTGGGR